MKWVLDSAHSEMVFKVKHMMISNVKGQFNNFSIDVDGDDIRNASVKVDITADSINTNSADRDNHLKSADFFDVEQYPEITFVSKSIVKEDEEDFVLVGDLTIKGITKEIKVDVEFGGIGKDPWGNEKAGYTVAGKINRKDWGLNWNAALETGGVLVSDEVKFSADLQFMKQA
ncbi:YceI family protein [Pseudopedobacter beijingensis]|uniref:YceI family protein n=1 Tax=Pseudopedobacter beijingensis TaxID=1207056 RepID=A0ABW4IE13_9SPHI